MSVLSPMAGFAHGVTAVTSRELRGRMRGRRAFVVLTVYLLLLAAIAFGIYAYLQRQADLDAALRLRAGEDMLGPLRACPEVRALGACRPPAVQRRPAARDAAGAGAQPRVHGRRHQLRARAPDPRPAGRDAAVHAGRGPGQARLGAGLGAHPHRGVGPAHVARVRVRLRGPRGRPRAYALLFTLAFGMGAVGLFLSALVRRTQAATVLASIVVLVVALGTIPVHTRCGASWGPRRRAAGTA
ncbi:MAG: hypothetical protein R3C32_09775 [Chloroflexota bacterium]